MYKKNIILTGATGFLGKHLLYEFLKNNFSVTALVRRKVNLPTDFNLKIVDINEKNWIEKIPTSETLIHCATSYGRKGESEKEIEKINVAFPQSLFLPSQIWGVKTWINIHTALPANLNTYAKSKETWLEIFKESNIPVKLNLVLEHFYGPGEDNTKFVTWLAQELLKKNLSIPLTLGDQLRDFIYIDDAVQAIAQCLQISWAPGFHEFYVASGQVIKIRDLALRLAQLCGANQNRLQFGLLPYRENEIMHSKNHRNLPPLPNWQSKIPLSEGLRRLVEFENLKLESSIKI